MHSNQLKASAVQQLQQYPCKPFESTNPLNLRLRAVTAHLTSAFSYFPLQQTSSFSNVSSRQEHFLREIGSIGVVAQKTCKKTLSYEYAESIATFLKFA